MDRAPAALVRELSPTLAHAELTHLDRQPIDLDLARAQHRAYQAVLARAGFELVHAPALPEHPDGVFVEDAVVVVDHLAVLTRSGAVSRRGETEGLAPLLSARGVRVVAMAGPGTLDGGDVLQVGETILVGRSTRTDGAGIERFRELIAPTGRTVIPVEVDGALHLKTALTALPDGTLVADLDHVPLDAFSGRRVLAAEEPSGADVLLLGDLVVVAASAPLTAAMLRSEGYEVETVDISELEKVEAGPTCPCVLLPPRRPRPGSWTGSTL